MISAKGARLRTALSKINDPRTLVEEAIREASDNGKTWVISPLRYMPGVKPDYEDGIYKELEENGFTFFRSFGLLFILW